MEIRFYIDLETELPQRSEIPPWWNEDRVREVLAQNEDQNEDEKFAEIEAAREAGEQP